MSEMELYSYFRSSCSWRVRIALNLKGLKYDYKAVNLLKGEQRGEDYKSINPLGTVPCLVVNSHALTQSQSIMEYLDEVYPDVPLLPRDDPVKRADVRRLCHVIVSDIQPVQNLKVLKHLGDDRKMEWAHWAIHQGFQALEKMLEKTAGKYCYGDEITMVDCCLVPQVFNANRRIKKRIDNFYYPLSTIKCVMSKPILYSFYLSSCSWRVRTVLALKDIPYEQKHVNLLKGEQKSKAFKDVNPSGCVPVFIHDGNVLTQSQSIIEYIEEVYPRVPLIHPKDPVKRAHVKSLCQVIVSDVQPLQGLSVLNYIGKERNTEFASWAIQKGFEALEKLLEKWSGQYCYGDNITMADVCLVPQVFNTKSRSTVNIEEFPNILRINKTLNQHDAFIASHPFKQPDYPEKS